MAGSDPMTSHPTGISRVQVVIPARNEEARLGACLGSVEDSARRLREVRPEIRVGVTVVLDRCTDASAAVASRFAVDVVISHRGNVGAARRAGIEHVTPGLADPSAGTWVACTDADTIVPATWLLDQVLQAGTGVQLVVGAVVPDPVDGDAAVTRRWRERHRGALAGDHVHGANLGFRLDVYRAVGGFPAVDEHEDVALVRALRAHGVRQGVAPTVVTSARLVGRTPGGFAGYLRGLAEGLRVEA